MSYNDNFPPLGGLPGVRHDGNGTWGRVPPPVPAYHPVRTTPKISFSLQQPKKHTMPMSTVNPYSQPIPSQPPPYGAPIGFPPQYNPTPPPPTPTVPKNVDPPHIHMFIHRAMAQARNEQERNYMMNEVQNIINTTEKRGKLFTCRWDIRPLPQIPRNSPPLQPQIPQQKLGKRKQVLDSQGAEQIIHGHKNKRMKRFQNDAPPSHPFQASRKKNMTIYKPKPGQVMVGTCTKLEKSFFRQVSEPHPNDVRPENILKKSLTLVKQKWRSGSVDYLYMCDQFKSIRQDMTMQRIKNEFTIEVYETHARIALENDDLNEFNQCQTKLKGLYDVCHQGHIPEFTAYRLLYLLNSGIKQGLYAPLLYAIQDLSPNELKHPFVDHTILLKNAVISKNYKKFFMLYHDCPNMGGFLIDKFITPIRLDALRTMMKAYLPTLSVSYIRMILGFPSDKECEEFLRSHGAVLIRGPQEAPALLVDTRKSSIRSD